MTSHSHSASGVAMHMCAVWCGRSRLRHIVGQADFRLLLSDGAERGSGRRQNAHGHIQRVLRHMLLGNIASTEPRSPPPWRIDEVLGELFKHDNLARVTSEFGGPLTVMMESFGIRIQ